MRDANLYLQTRARLQRLSDMKFFSGWVESMENTEVRIRLKPSKAVVGRGDQFSVEVAGKTQTAVFIGEVSEVNSSVVVLDLPRGVAFLPKKENARVSMFGYRGRLIFEGCEYQFTLVDVSENGLGLVVSGEIERGATIQFEVFTPLGQIEGEGEVRYCRTDTENANQFRVGILMQELGRIERARWNHLLDAGAPL
jgi:hypothetical protein